MLPRVHRLSKQKDFDNLFQGRKNKQNDFLIVRFAPNHQKVSRFGFAVSTRVDKKAVVRNRLRRQLSEAVRKNLKSIRPEFDILLTAKPKIVEADFGEIKDNLLSLLKSCGLYD